MDNFGRGGGNDGFPVRNGRGGGGGFNDSFIERGAPPPFSNQNGMLARHGAPGGAPHHREEPSGRGQPSHEVFMVREASRSSINNPPADRLPFAGAPPDPLNLTEKSSSSSNATSHHHRSDREREAKEGKLVLPRMLKIAVIGDSTAGKTAICNAFTSEGYSFSRNYHMTTAVSVYAKSVKLPTAKTGGEGNSAEETASPSDDSLLLEPRINLVLVDSAGKPLYRELLPHYWDQLDGLALVIDLTSSTALETASAWLNLGKECLKGTKSRLADNPGDQSGRRGGADHHLQSTGLGVLIGSKADLKEQRVISPKAAQDFASQQGLQYFECSAKENRGMEEPFFYLAHQWATTTPGAQTHHQKENLGGSGGAGAAGGIFPQNHGNSNAPNASRRSVFASRQSSSEAF